MEKGTSFLIEDGEKEGLSKRLKDAIGSESINSFAKRSSLSEGTVRNIIVNGVMPRLDNLIAMANTAGVTVEWLATGRGAKTYAQAASNDADLSNPPSEPLMPGTALYNKKMKAIGEVMAAVNKTYADSIEFSGYKPHPAIGEYLKTFIFSSIIGNEIDIETATMFLNSIKQIEEEKKES